jgi:energy-coupling factor transporter ATP-binding protein EcfA2
MLETSGLTIRYGNRSKPAVSQVSLKLDPGEFTLLTGDSASGKSTLMQAICGFIPNIVPAEVSGTVRIGGKSYDDPIAIARVACMVQQDPETQFCTETVEEEIAFGPENFRYPPEKIRKTIDDSLRAVNALHLKDRKLSTLSGGEKQKIAIASMLALEPNLLILDEPTSSLDPKSVNEVIEAIKALRERADITTIVVEHRLGGFLDVASRIIHMSEGRIVSNDLRGTPGFEDIRRAVSSPIEFPQVRRRQGTMLTVTGLSYEISGKKILDDVTFEIEEGSVVALMGENGAGKTTLLRHIVGLVKPQRGAIEVFDHSMGNGHVSDPWVLAKDVGLVFQNPNHQIFESSVEKELQFASINFGLPLDEANRAVLSFEESEHVSRHVHPHCLSIGQKRRVNILSSSSHGPKLILLDEPFIGQDRMNTTKIAGLLADLQREGRTIIVVTHDEAFARTFCTDVLVLKGGRLLAAGDASAVIRDQQERLFERWAA